MLTPPNPYVCMKTFRIENFGSDIYQTNELGGATHSIIEALFFALKEKSWSKILSIRIDPTTFEGFVEYVDEFSEDDTSDEVYSYIHKHCFYVANLLRNYLRNDLLRDSKDNQFFGFVNGLHYAMAQEIREPMRESVVASIAYSVNRYIQFIKELASELKAGKRYRREFIEAKFMDMGFSFPKD